jgi:hypothetical protein
MTQWINEKPYSHTSHNGTHFSADRCDLKGGVKITRPDYVDDMRFAADCAEFGAMHVILVHERLNGFQGFTAIHYELQAEVDEDESEATSATR